MPKRYAKQLTILLVLMISTVVLAQENQPLFEGITYIRDERTALRSMVIHVILIDLQTTSW